MSAQERLKSLLPHGIIIMLFAILSCAFCYPAFQGNTMYQHDMNTWLEGSKESRDYYEATGENALWANNMFSGMPLNLTDFYSEHNWYSKLNHLVQFYTHGKVPNPATFFFLAMISFYILGCVMGIKKWLSAIGAAAFAFSAYNPQIISAGHVTKMLDIAFLPGVLAGIVYAYKGKYFSGAAITGIFLAFMIDAGHWQIIYYGAILIMFIIIAELVIAIRRKTLPNFLKASTLLLLAAILATGVNATRLLLLQEYSPYSTRGGNTELVKADAAATKSKGLDKDYAFSWSVGTTETLCLLVPNMYGGSTGENIGTDSHLGESLSQMGVPAQQIDQITQRAPLYWGAQQEMMNLAGPNYFGAVVCFLFVLAIVAIRSKLKWVFVAAAALFLLIAMGKNFAILNFVLFDYLPGFNKFRSPNMAASISSMLFPLLGIWALNDIFSGKIDKETLTKKLKLSIGITAGLCFVILLASKTMFDYKGERDKDIEQQYGQAGSVAMKAIREDRAAAASSDALRSLVLVLLSGGVLWAYSKNKLQKEMAIAGIGLLIAIDLIPVAHRYLNKNNFISEEDYALQFEPSPADVEVLKDKTLYYRVLDLTGGSGPFNDGKPSLFHKSIGGYHGAKMQIYQDLIENHLSKLNSSVLNMLNTKYFIVPTQKGQGMPQQNPGALGNAWFVHNIQWVNSANEEMAALNAPSLQNPMDTSMGHFNPATTAIMRDQYKKDAGQIQAIAPETAIGTITLNPDGYSPKKLSYTANSTVPALAVFSDIYYPIGWKATIDGKEAPILKANYVLRALNIPAGTHKIEFTYDSPAFEKGETYALISSILLTLLVAAGVYFGCYRKRNQDLKLDTKA